MGRSFIDKFGRRFNRVEFCVVKVSKKKSKRKPRLLKKVFWKAEKKIPIAEESGGGHSYLMLPDSCNTRSKKRRCGGGWSMKRDSGIIKENSSPYTKYQIVNRGVCKGAKKKRK